MTAFAFSRQQKAKNMSENTIDNSIAETGSMQVTDDFNKMPKNLSPIVANLLGCVDNAVDMSDKDIRQARHEEMYQKYLSLD